MPNIINENGLQTKTEAEITSELQTEYATIYGADINVGSDTPDGQTIGIFSRIIVDLLELLTNIYNFFDPDQAIGRVLDQRVAINGIQRQGGTYTITPVEIITTLPNVYLPGLDQDLVAPFTVSDEAGTEFYLVLSQTIASPGTNSFSFRAAETGAVETIENTITVPVSIVLGVESVNNPLPYTSIGTTEETDQTLKVRRQKSVSIAAEGYLDALKAALLNVTGVVSANVYENDTSEEDADGIPPHTIWVVIQGSPSSEDIADVIFAKRGSGAGMKGEMTYSVTLNDGRLFEVRWDTVSPQDLFIYLQLASVDGINDPLISLIKTQLPLLLVPGAGEKVDVTEVGAIVQQIDPNCYLVTATLEKEVSGGGVIAGQNLSPDSLAGYFTIDEDDIIITPIILSPKTPTIQVGGTQTFTPLGGLAPYTFSLLQDESGATLNTSTGEYEAGVSTGTDIVRVIDANGNTATSTILVVT